MFPFLIESIPLHAIQNQLPTFHEWRAGKTLTRSCTVLLGGEPSSSVVVWLDILIKNVRQNQDGVGNALWWIREGLRRKYRIIWEFFPNSRPPTPLLRTPRPKKNYGLFRILGPKEHFWFSQKFHFLSVFWHIHLGIGDPPLKIKISKIGLRHVLSWPKLGLEPKFYESGTFGGFGKREQSLSQIFNTGPYGDPP